MLDQNSHDLHLVEFTPFDWPLTSPPYHGSARKWLFDRGLAFLVLALFALLVVALVPLNFIFNRGPLFFVQTRMGHRCQPFRAIKFRTMRAEGADARGAFDEVEEARITPLGRLLRHLHLDEVPQVLNVLGGQMSFIGPRPDCFAHAEVYVRTIPGYRARHSVLPGISGKAQVDCGYAQDHACITRKVAADLDYIDHASFREDVRICWRTIRVMLGRKAG